MAFKLDAIVITPDLLNLIAEIDSFNASWRFLGDQQPEILKALRTSATIESIGSSTRLAGSKLSDKEVEQLLTNIENNSLATHAIPPLAFQILTFFENNAQLTISMLETMTQANRSTLKKYVSSLVQQGRIKQHGQGKRTWYTKK